MTPDQFATSLLARLDHVESQLVAAGWPTMSTWWSDTLRSFTRAQRRQLVARVGRRGGKSSTCVRFAIAFALVFAGADLVPRGDTGWVVFVSARREEALSRLHTIEAALRAMRIPFDPADGDAIRIRGTHIGFRVQAPNIASVSGWTSILIVCDEVAKWRDVDTGVNPATEILAALRPTLASQPLGRILLISSPLSTLDAHAKAFDSGESDFQIVARAATWEANPTISESDTRALEPDDAIWRREYAAIPSEDEEEGLFTAAELDAVTRAEPVDLPPSLDRRSDRSRVWRYFAAMDPATRRDAWTLVVAGRRGTERTIRVCMVRQWLPRGSTLSPESVLTSISSLISPFGLFEVSSDQASADALSDIGRRVGVRVLIEPTSAGSKIDGFDNLRLLVSQKEIELAPDRDLRADLLSVRRRFTRSGVSIELPRQNGRHCDYAPALVLAVRQFPPINVARFIPQPQSDLRWAPTIWGEGGGRGY